MARAIVLINTDVGMEEEVAKMLSQIPEVKEAYVVYGIYDVVAIIEAESFDRLRNVVISKIRKMPHIKASTTLIVVEK
ncbi:MAG: Lrp/AsnC ligand binding domain-containing protein [Ignisphaera sp.]|jgi:DNA-binding Lrp family transcriptional regulator|nr:Lrp/AsnC ligand binding domain-containing protein [Ignisphaera sp.]MCC6055608.1 Lrp/AsnC ligand binding domain-containing protein [Desulfurococcaceae archaeon]